MHSGHETIVDNHPIRPEGASISDGGRANHNFFSLFAVSNPSLFQVRFQLPPGVFCNDYIVSTSHILNGHCH